MTSMTNTQVPEETPYRFAEGAEVIRGWKIQSSGSISVRDESTGKTTMFEFDSKTLKRTINGSRVTENGFMTTLLNFNKDENVCFYVSW